MFAVGVFINSVIRSVVGAESRYVGLHVFYLMLYVHLKKACVYVRAGARMLVCLMCV